MPICGLVVTLDSDHIRAENVVTALRDHPAVTVGEKQGLRLPIATDTASQAEDKQLWEWLKQLDGVRHIDVVYAHIGEPEDGIQRQEEAAHHE
jgi:nitrate reductase NapAB chaperone NapD